MALSMHTNYASLVTQNNLNRTNDLLNTSMERLSTGLRINSAADDAAGLQISNRLEAQTRGMSVAMRNAQDGISLLQTAEGAMDEMTNIAYRMNDLATQAANGTNTQSDRDALQAEYAQLGAELQNIFENSNFGGRSLFSLQDSGSLTHASVQFQIGSTTAETLTVDTSSQLTNISNSLKEFNIDTEQKALQTQAKADYEAEAATFLAAAQGGVAGTVTSGLTDGVDFVATTTSIEGTYTDLADLQAQAAAGTGTAASDLANLDAAVKASVSNEIQTNTDGNYVAGDTGLTLASTSYDDIMALNVGIETQQAATAAMSFNSSLIDSIGETRAQFGANINRLDHTITNLQNMSENLAASKGRITDADFAVESANMTKNQMLMQAGTQMLAQSKQLPGMAMSLLG